MLILAPFTNGIHNIAKYEHIKKIDLCQVCSHMTWPFWEDRDFLKKDFFLTFTMDGSTAVG